MKFRRVSASVLTSRPETRRDPAIVRNERLVRAYLDAFVRRDLEAARAFCAPDIRMQAAEPDGTPGEALGFDEAMAFSLRRIEALGLSVRYEVVDTLSDGDRVALLFAPVDPEAVLPAEPQRMVVYTIRDGLIRSLRVYEGPTT